MPQQTSQKIAFITGGNRGLGFQTALDLGPLNIHVVIGSRDAAKGEEAVTKLRQAGITADYLVFDIQNPEDHAGALAYCQSKFGHLDILVNNAGYAADEFSSGHVTTTSETTVESLRKHFDIN